MIERTIEQVAQMAGAVFNGKESGRLVAGVSIDSRQIGPGNLFVPLKGENTDGHQFAEKALSQGAGAVFWQKSEPHPPQDERILIVEDTLEALQKLAASYRSELDLKVVGITGSNGKTSTKDMTAAVLEQTYSVQKTEGNFNNHIGLPLTILGLRESTEVAILEMGMSARGEISLLTNIARPDVALITNIGEAHLLDLGSREEIAAAKFEITEGLRENGLFIYPGDEPLLQEKVAALGHVRKATFGEGEGNDLHPADEQFEERGSFFTAALFPGETFFLPVAGKHNIMNALAALLAARELSVPASSMKRGLQSVRLSNMRMEWLDGIKNTTILNDSYNSSPTALRAVIGMLEEMDNGKDKVLVVGDMLELGEREKEFHKEIGKEISSEKIRYVYTYGHLGKWIAEGAREHFPENRVHHFHDQEALITSLKSMLEGNELIVVKASRGMKMEKIVEALAVKPV